MQSTLEMDMTMMDTGYVWSSLVAEDQAVSVVEEEVAIVEDEVIWVTPEEEDHLPGDRNIEYWSLAYHHQEAGKT